MKLLLTIGCFLSALLSIASVPAFGDDIVWSVPQLISSSESWGAPSAIADYQGSVYLALSGISGLPEHIYVTRYDGSTWSLPIDIHGAQSSSGASLAVHGGRLFAVWKGNSNDSGIYWASYDGHSWSQQQKIPNVGTGMGISVAEFRGKLYAVWKGIGTSEDQGIYWTAFNDQSNSWGSQSKITGVGTAQIPALTSFLYGNSLVAVWRGVGYEVPDHGLYWASFDPSSGNWSPQRKIAGVGSDLSPKVTEMGIEVFAVWTGLAGDRNGRSDNTTIYISSKGKDTDWAAQKVIPGLTGFFPIIGTHDGRLFLVYGKSSRGINWMTGTAAVPWINPSHWRPGG